ncbi:MAG: hypothetical protein GY906_04810 [bacterium]|nr:hypothetical protein [bacterium]
MESENILTLVAQYAQLEARIRPLLPAISAKLVSELLADGVRPEKLGKVLNKKPTYIQAIANGQKALTAEQIIAVMRHVAASTEAQTEGSDNAE